MNAQRVVSSASASASSSSLVPLERSTKPLRWRETPAQRVLHSRWAAERHAVIDALLSGSRAEVRRAERLQGCCSHPMLTLGSDAGVGVRLFCCRDRMCPRCSVGRSRQCESRISSRVLAMNAPRQVELTIKHRNASLRSEIERLMDAFRDLRKSRFWRDHVKHGVAVLEVTLNEKTRLWHPHLHLIVDGEFMPQVLLSRAWSEATGDSCIVYVQAVHDRERGAKYVSKYLGKSVNPTALHGFEIREYARTMHGRRLVFVFGKAPKAIDIDAAAAAEKTTRSNMLLLQRLIDAARVGFGRSREALALLQRACRVVRVVCGASREVVAEPEVKLSVAESVIVTAACGDIEAERYGVLVPRKPNKRQRAKQRAELEQRALRFVFDAPGCG